MRALDYAIGLLLMMAAQGLAVAADDPHARALAAFHRGDVVTAMSTLRPAADAGDAKAQVLLAYINEKSGLDADAARYYGLATAQGDPEGEYGLAELYLSGRGVPRDPAKALSLYESAAARGHGGSITVVAQAYRTGARGLDKAGRSDAQKVSARRLAADRGYKPAAAALARAYQEGLFGLPADSAEAQRWSKVAGIKPAVAKKDQKK